MNQNNCARGSLLSLIMHRFDEYDITRIKCLGFYPSFCEYSFNSDIRLNGYPYLNPTLGRRFMVSLAYSYGGSNDDYIQPRLVASCLGLLCFEWVFYINISIKPSAFFVRHRQTVQNQFRT